MLLDNFENLTSSWQEVLNKCSANHIFLTSQWQRAWWQSFGSDYKQLLLSIQENNKTVGIAPLKQEGRKVSFIGNTDVCDYMDFIIEQGHESSVFPQILKYIESIDWNIIELESLLPQSLTLKYFVPLVRDKGYHVDIKQTDVSPQLFLPLSWDDYISSLESKDRHELQRKMRRLQMSQAADTYTVVEKAKLQLEMEIFFKLFSLSGDQKANFMNDKRKYFFKTMTALLAEKNYLKLSIMVVGGKPASATLCFDYGKEIYLYNSAYDPVFSNLSVSLLLEAFCIKEAINQGRKRFDFLRGNEAYKYDLGGQDVPVYRCTITRG